MPWLTILVALLSFFVSKKNGASNTKALVTAGLAGAGTYYVTHDTEWGKTNLGEYDGVIADGTVPLAAETGAAVTKEDGTTPVKAGSGSTIGKLIESGGGSGTAAAVGGFTFGALLSNPNVLLWGGLALGLFLLAK